VTIPKSNNGGSNYYGDSVVKSVVSTTNSLNGYETKLLYSSPSFSVSGCARDQASYSFGSNISSTCWWNGENLHYEIDFAEKNDNSFNPHDQNYHFRSTNGANVGVGQWNFTNSVGSGISTILNRSLGKPSAIVANTTLTNQASNSANSTLINNSHLLGLQSINPTRNRDVNSNRPQLSTSWYRTNDNFGAIISTNDKSINGRIARTGHPSLRSSVPLNKRCLVILSKTI
jgi:hypothetical protein